MIKINFKFEEFLTSKGFFKLNDSNFKYILEDGNFLIMEIIGNKYRMSHPDTDEIRFSSNIPTSEEQAERHFKNIEELSDIKF